MEEFENSLISALVFLAHLGVLQVRSGSHPAMDLSWESLDVLGDLQVCLKVLDVLGGLVFRGQEYHGDVHGLCIVGVDHGRVALRDRLE